MSLWIAIVLVILPSLVIIWWIDVSVDDEFYDSFKREYQPTVHESRFGVETKARLSEGGTEFSAEKSHRTCIQTV